MTELLGKNFDIVFPELHQYTYNGKNEYASGLRGKYPTYNDGMKADIIYLKKESGNYKEVNQYFKAIAEKCDNIQVNRKVLGGMPTIVGSRIPVSLLIACVKDEMTIEEICAEYGLTKYEVEKAMEYVVEILDTPYQEGLE